MLLLVLMALVAGAWPFWSGHGPGSAGAALHFDDLTAPVAGVGLIGIAATVGTVLAWRHRLLALVLMGAAGLVVCLVFVWFSAPDLALTQLLVEVVTVVLMMLALRWLPAESPPERRPARALRDAVIALGVGLGLAALVWLVLTRPFGSISPYFLEQTLPLGGGANAVNVIIVDFRAFDTLGEITVLGIAALIVHALLADLAPQAPVAAGLAADRHPLMLQLVSRLVLPFAVLISLHLFLRGHNLPGGGFIAGLVLAIGLVLQHVAHGQRWVGERSGGDFRSWVAWGLLVAAATGAASAWFGAPFLTSTYDYPWVPGIGGVPLASASAFDLGVYLVVVGGTMAMLLALARLSLPSSSRGV